MFIFRVEHDRELCKSLQYSINGDSPTGHGPHSGCTNFWGPKPNFGEAGRPPAIRMMVHERCAVTAQQFRDWIDHRNPCRNLTEDCEGDFRCWQCPPIPGPPKLHLLDGWNIVAYSVTDTQEGIDWRIDNNQVVFNPTFAERIGVVQEAEVKAFVAA